MSCIAIITARGGSKRIPKKNIKEFCGKPIIAYSIEAAIESGIFEEVMVSTDSQEIADISIKYGARVPFLRSQENSNDYATTEDAVIEVLDKYQNQGKDFDMVCCIYPTAPFVTAKKLKEAIQLINSDVDSVIPVVKYGFPPQRALIKKNGYMEYQYPEDSLKRSQDLEPIYHDSGQFYFCKVDVLYKTHDLISPKSVPYEIPEEEVQDIDNYSDWEIAQLKYKYMISKDSDNNV